MSKKVDILAIHKELEKFQATVSAPVVELMGTQGTSPFKVLIATILSARTKDETTTVVIKRLFKKVKKPGDFDKYTQSQVEEMIYPVGFYKNKAKFLKALPAVLDEEFGDKIPDDVESLTKLPGVGRKTANLVVAVGFNKPAICVDTHVHKIMNRLGYVKTKNPLETEMALRKKMPEKIWISMNGYMVAFGQNLCRPISPHCSKCPIRKHCNRVGVTSSR